MEAAADKDKPAAEAAAPAPGALWRLTRRYWPLQLALLAALLAPLLAVAVYSFSAAGRQLEEQAIAKRQAAAYLAAATLRERFDRFAGIGASIAAQPGFRSAVAGGAWADAAKLVEGLPREQSSVDRVLVIDPAGAVRAAVPASAGAAEDLSGERWLARMKADGRAVVSGVRTRPTVPPLNVVDVAVPVPAGAAGTAALALEITTDTLTEWARAVDVGLGGIVIFVDDRGAVAAHPKYSPQGPIRDLAGFPGVAELLKGKSATLSAKVDGEESIVVAEPVREYGWGVIVVQPKEAAFALREEYLRPVVFAYGLIMIANLLLALGIIRMARKNHDAYEREKAYLAALGDGVVVVDASTAVVRMNPHAEELLGWSLHEARGRNFLELVPFQDEKGETLPATLRPVAFALKSGQKRSVSTTPTYYYGRKDGSRFPVAATATPLFDGNGVSGAILVFRDITQEKQVDRAKSEFVSLASHELLTPAAALKGYAHLLQDGTLGTLDLPQKDAVGKIALLSDRMIGLIDTLLNVSRIELGTFSVQPAPTDLRALAQGVILDLSSKLKEKDIGLAQFFDVDLPPLNVDPNLIRIVLMNLLSNAVRYSGEGGQVSMSIEARPTVVVVTVADKGIGIPRDQQSKIFAKFYRAHNARQAVLEGNGLGLYVAKSIVEQAGGRIWFASQEGKGTTFYVTLPLSGMKPREGSKELGYPG